MRKTLTILAAMSLAACNSSEDAATTDGATIDPAAETADPMAMGEGTTPTDGMGYVAMAGASDLYEIQSSELAVEKSQNEEVRTFAQHMIEQHRMTTEQVTTAAQAAGLTPPPPQLNAMQQEMIAQLEGAEGEQFDTTYLQQQRQAHDMALSLHRGFAENGDTQQLQQVASEAVPIVEQHISQLEGMNAG